MQIAFLEGMNESITTSDGLLLVSFFPAREDATKIIIDD